LNVFSEDRISSLSAEADIIAWQSISEFCSIITVLPGTERSLGLCCRVTERCLGSSSLRKDRSGNHLILPLRGPKCTRRPVSVHASDERDAGDGRVHGGVYMEGYTTRDTLDLTFSTSSQETAARGAFFLKSSAGREKGCRTRNVGAGREMSVPDEKCRIPVRFVRFRQI